MNRILLLIACMFISCQLLAQSRNFDSKSWHKKYYSTPPVVKKIKWSKKRVIVYYDTLIRVDMMQEEDLRVRRVSKVCMMEVFSQNSVERTITLDKNDLKYYELHKSGRTVSIQFKNGTGRNDVDIPLNYLEQSDVSITNPSSGTVYNIITTTDTALSKRDIINLVGDLNPKNFYLGINYTPALAYRTIGLNSTNIKDISNIFTRDTTETARFGQSFSIQAGYTFNGRSTFLVEYIHMRQGFNSTRSLDWRTGADTMVNPTDYLYYGNGVGFGYNYSGYRYPVNLEFDLGVYYTFITSYEGGVQIPDSVHTNLKNRKDYIRSLGMQTNMFGVRAGLGLNIRPSYRFAIKAVPTIYYNLTNLNKAGAINTHLYNVGMTFGVSCRIGKNWAKK